MSKMNSAEDLKKKLKIKDIKDLKDPKNQNIFIEKVKADKISPELLTEILTAVPELTKAFTPELLKEILTAVPELTKAFTEVIKAMKDIGTSLEETKRIRWQVLQQIASSGNLSGDQILEAMQIIQEIEENESIDWESVFKTVIKVVGVIVAVAVFVLSRGRVKPKV